MLERFKKKYDVVRIWKDLIDDLRNLIDDDTKKRYDQIITPCDMLKLMMTFLK